MIHARRVTVVGIGADGCEGLTNRAKNAVLAAQVLVGAERHLAFFPEFPGERLVVQGPLEAVLERIALRAREHQVCVLASGDPLFFGIGSRLARVLRPEQLEFLPGLSSVQWAFARTGIAWEDADFVSLHGRSLDGLVARLKGVAKAACLTDGHHTPPRIARHLLEHGDGGWHAWVGENLGGPEERARSLSLPELAEAEVGPQSVLLLRRDPAWQPPPTIPFLPEDAFARRMPRKGLITKREVRTLALAQLALRADSVLWDVGAGSGAVAVEAARLACRGRVYAVEADPESVELCRDNCRRLGADNVRVIAGLAPEALLDLEAPGAVFVGGSRGRLGAILDIALGRLLPGGRLVVNAVTLETVGEAHRLLRGRGLTPEVLLVQVARGEPLAGGVRYDAQNPVHIFAVEKS